MIFRVFQLNSLLTKTGNNSGISRDVFRLISEPGSFFGASSFVGYGFLTDVSGSYLKR